MRQVLYADDSGVRKFGHLRSVLLWMQSWAEAWLMVNGLVREFTTKSRPKLEAKEEEERKAAPSLVVRSYSLRCSSVR